VLCLDHNSNEETFSKVVAHSILENNDDWYELEMEDGTILKLTGNHRVWLPELNCYRRVDDLCEGDDILQKK
jgi:hypothetical protein